MLSSIVISIPVRIPDPIGRAVRIPVIAKNTMKVSIPQRFFSYIIYYKILIVFLKRISRSLIFILGIIYLKKHYTNDDDNSHITAILQ